MAAVSGVSGCQRRGYGRQVHMLALGDPVRLLAPGDPGVAEAVGQLGFAQVAFGVDAAWTDRISRHEHIAEVRVAEFGAHEHDEVIGVEALDGEEHDAE